MANKRTPKVLGLLDLGSAKVAAAVVVVEPSATVGAPPALRMAGLGLQKSRGVKAGVLTDLDEAEAAVMAALAQAERAAGVTVDSLTVSFAGGRLQSQHFMARAEVRSNIVSDDDLSRLMDGARAFAERNGRLLVHMNRLASSLDGGGAIHDPRGFAGHHLASQIHAITADEGPVRNLLMLMERCRVGCDGIVAAPYASALAATTEEERALGITCIDIGAGTASAAVFADGRFIGADVMPFGGHHLSFDIAKALQTPLVEAERIKTLYGTLVTAQSDEHESFSYPLAGSDEEEEYHATRAQLTDIIRPRMAQVLGEITRRLAQNKAVAEAGEALVLTGGSSQILGVSEFASELLARPVRAATPTGFAGCPASSNSAPLATLYGLARAAVVSRQAPAGLASSSPGGCFGRLGSWLKTGF